jgi:hypothetical protein
MIVLLLLLFNLTANVYLPGGSGTIIRHNTQITHKQNIAHKTSQLIKDTLHTLHTMQILLQLQQIQLQLCKLILILILFSSNYYTVSVKGDLCFDQLSQNPQRF